MVFRFGPISRRGSRKLNTEKRGVGIPSPPDRGSGTTRDTGSFPYTVYNGTVRVWRTNCFMAASIAEKALQEGRRLKVSLDGIYFVLVRAL